MTARSSPLSPPAGLEDGGRRLWQQLLAQDGTLEDALNPHRATALEACRTQDRCDSLHELCQHRTPVVETEKGPVADAAWVEVRQQSALLARLIAALRLPDEATGKRPQRRQTRGVQRPSAVSSLDRARERRARSAGA